MLLTSDDAKASVLVAMLRAKDVIQTIRIPIQESKLTTEAISSDGWHDLPWLGMQGLMTRPPAHLAGNKGPKASFADKLSGAALQVADGVLSILTCFVGTCRDYVDPT